MSRPPSTDGGRPVSVHLRLSAQEAAKVDAVRKSLSRPDWFRSHIPATVSTERVNAAAPAKINDRPEPAFKEPALAEADTREVAPTRNRGDAWGGGSPTDPPDFGAQPESTPAPTPVSAGVHRHKRGAQRTIEYVKGQAVRHYYCTEPGCMEDLVT